MISISSAKARLKQTFVIGLADAKFNILKEIQLSASEKQRLQKCIKQEKKSYCLFTQNDKILIVVKPPKSNLPEEKEHFRQIAAKIFNIAKTENATSIGIIADYAKEIAPAFVEGLGLSAYEFSKYFSDKNKRFQLSEIQVKGLTGTQLTELQNLLQATFNARSLVNEPLSYLTAMQYSKEIEKLSKEAGFSFEYFTRKKIESLKMGGLLGVNKGSAETPTFNILEYKPSNGRNKKPIVFVGKGVVFDTGGSSLKSPRGMMTMKADMGGSAAVVGAIYAIAKNKLPIHVVGLIPATENRLAKDSIVPGDVLTMYSKQTVEVLNTDAEGRLILADALHYAKKLNPELVIDLATLTGSAKMAVGEYGAVAMEKNAEKHYIQLENAGVQVHERLVKFPLWAEYGEMLKSDVADIKNIGGAEAGAITAGKFLEFFTDYPWIHIDLSNAFVDSSSGYRSAGGTGAGVRLLYEFAKNYK